MIAALILLAAVVGLYHVSARRILIAAFKSPADWLTAAQGHFRIEARTLRIRRAALTRRAEGGTFVGAFLMTAAFAVAFTSEIEVFAVSIGPLIGFQLPESAEQALGRMMIAATATTAVAASWILFELFRSRFLATGELSLPTRIVFGLCASTAVALICAFTIQSSLYRASVSSDLATTSGMPIAAAIDDPVTAALSAPAAGTVPAAAPESRVLTWTFVGLGTAVFLLLIPGWHLGPLALFQQLEILWASVAAVAAAVLITLLAVTHAALGWAFEVAHTVMELVQRIVISAARPIVTWMRDRHDRERARNDEGRPLVFALTSWANDVELPRAAIGDVPLHEDVASEAVPPSSPENGSAFDGETATDAVLGKPTDHVWEAFPTGNAGHAARGEPVT